MIGARDAVPGRSDLVASMERLLAIGGVPVERRFVPMGDGALHVLEAGKGDPLVLLHGAGGGAANWFGVIEGLTDRFRLLAPDLPGFGLSDPIDLTSPLASVRSACVTGSTGRHRSVRSRRHILRRLVATRWRCAWVGGWTRSC